MGKPYVWQGSRFQSIINHDQRPQNPLLSEEQNHEKNVI